MHLILLALACGSGDDVPPGGWANAAPTVVEQAVDRGEQQLLHVRQGDLRAWVQVPDVSAKAGDYVLLGQGEMRTGVSVPEVGPQPLDVVDIAHVRVVDEETARRAVGREPPPGALTMAQAYAELDQRNGTPVVVFGRAVKVTSAVGSVWIHLQDGSGDPAAGTHDLTVQAQEPVVKGQWVAFRGTLRKDVDLGFGYHYAALVEEAQPVE